MFWGIVLIILGVLLLLNEFGIVYWSHWGALWPIIIIALGVKMIFAKKKENPPKI